MGRLARLLPVVLAAAALAACRTAKPGDPPTVRFGKDVCTRCGMIVSEARFAAGRVDERGASLVYDDVGELLADAARDASLGAVAYVHDAEEDRWVKAAEASYVRVPALATPMGTGFAAFGSAERAQAFVRRFAGTIPILALADAVRAAAAPPAP